MNMYEDIGNKIQSSLNLFAGDVVVWLSLDGMSVTTLYRIDDGYGQWEDDWYEGQKDVQLIDYCLLDDLKPVTHARWRWTLNYHVICTKCQYVLPSGFPVSDFRFCPYCGAKMDEEVE